MAGFIDRLTTRYCVTEGNFFDSVLCYEGGIGIWGTDYYIVNASNFLPDAVPLYATEYYTPNVYDTWPEGVRIPLVEFDLFDTDDVARLRVFIYAKSDRSYNYARIDYKIVDLNTQAVVSETSDLGAVTITSTWPYVNYSLCIYRANASATLLGIGFVFISTKTAGWNSTYLNKNSFYIDLYKLIRDYSLREVPFDIHEFSPEYGEASGAGGYSGGTFDDSSDVISIPSMPAMGVTSAGFINVYAPTSGELNQFGSELFPDLSFTPVSQGGAPSSVTDALVAMAQVLVDFGNQIPQLIDMYINANLIQYVIDCHLIPVSPTTSGTASLKVGFKTFSQAPAKVTSDYVDFDCGSLNVGEYYANFADYAPYTSAKLYLPFVGFMDIAPEYWQSGTLNVVYRFNVIDGSFVAYVKSTSSKSKLADSVIAQFGGNACVHIPITGLNYASMVSGIVSAVSPLLPSSKSNGGLADKLVNSANTIAAAKPTMQQSNGYNATTSFLTVRFPYLLIERSVSNYSKDFAKENGIPSNITTSFASLTGLTKATMLHLDGISGATDDDLDEIAQLLSEGIIL